VAGLGGGCKATLGAVWVERDSDEDGVGMVVAAVGGWCWVGDDCGGTRSGSFAAVFILVTAKRI